MTAESVLMNINLLFPRMWGLDPQDYTPHFEGRFAGLHCEAQKAALFVWSSNLCDEDEKPSAVSCRCVKLALAHDLAEGKQAIHHERASLTCSYMLMKTLRS